MHELCSICAQKCSCLYVKCPLLFPSFNQQVLNFQISDLKKLLLEVLKLFQAYRQIDELSDFNIHSTGMQMSLKSTGEISDKFLS